MNEGGGNCWTMRSFAALTYRMHYGGVQCLCVVAATALLLGCTSAPKTHGKVEGEAFRAKELVQSDSNRFASIAMQENLESLMRLADKLYQRNPAHWRKTAASREAALAALRTAMWERKGWPALADQQDVQALSTALSPEFGGDRVAAFVYAMGDMLITAHGGKIQFSLIDGLDAQRVYNAARNVEIANWVLNTRKDAKGQLLLQSNFMSETERNLSFEREMGKVIARLDLLASYNTESLRRVAIGWGQSLVGGPLLQFFPVR